MALTGDLSAMSPDDQALFRAAIADELVDANAGLSTLDIRDVSLSEGPDELIVAAVSFALFCTKSCCAWPPQCLSYL